MASHLQLYDAKGQTILLGRKLGEGAQGAVFEVEGAPQLAAKWYKDKHLPNPDQIYKITSMTQGCDTALTSIAAWPITTLHKSPSGFVCGFMMPKMSGYRPIHVLYSPANRKFSFPRADWAFLVHTARNVSSAVATIHSHGHVIGDINQNNVMVGENATAKLIDCDSFQMRVNGRNFLCDVGVPEFTPPELHGKNFAGLIRTTNHDSFGLAVMIFHLLFMGRHPFAGRFLGKDDKPIDAAIKEFRFAFGQAATARQMALPPHSLSLLQTSAAVASLFERAFSESAARGSMRPTAQEWLNALDKFRGDLAACSVVPAHKFHRSLTNCPWCEIQRNSGPDFFISVTIGATIKSASNFDPKTAWNAITAISPPDIGPLIIRAFSASTKPTPFPPYLGFTKKQAFWLRGGTFAVAAVTVAGVPFAISLALTFALLFVHYYVAPNARERRKRHAEVTALEKAVRAKQEEWSRVGNDLKLQFLTKLKALEDCKNRYGSIVNSKKQELDQLQHTREKEQRKEFLERHFIKNYRIEGIGQGRRATLLSYGIETFYDITPAAINQVPGFGPMLTNTLLALRRLIETQFRFDPNKGVNPSAVLAIEQKYALQRIPLEKVLLGGSQELAPFHRAAQQQRITFTDSTTELTKALAQAKVNSAVTEHDPWQAIVAIVLVFGFVFQFAVSPMTDTSKTATPVVNAPVVEPKADTLRTMANRMKSSALPEIPIDQTRSSGIPPAVRKSGQIPNLGEDKKGKPSRSKNDKPSSQANGETIAKAGSVITDSAKEKPQAPENYSVVGTDSEKARSRLDVIQKIKETRAGAAKLLALHETERQRLLEEYNRRRELYYQGQIKRNEVLKAEQALTEAMLRVDEGKRWLAETDSAIREYMQRDELLKAGKTTP